MIFLTIFRAFVSPTVYSFIPSSYLILVYFISIYSIAISILLSPTQDYPHSHSLYSLTVTQSFPSLPTLSFPSLSFLPSYPFLPYPSLPFPFISSPSLWFPSFSPFIYLSSPSLSLSQSNPSCLSARQSRCVGSSTQSPPQRFD